MHREYLFWRKSNKPKPRQRMYWKEVSIILEVILAYRNCRFEMIKNRRLGFIDPSKTKSIIIHLFSFFQAESGQKLSWKYFRQLCDYCSKTACCASCSNRPNQIMVVVVARPQSSISKKTKTSRGKKRCFYDSSMRRRHCRNSTCYDDLLPENEVCSIQPFHFFNQPTIKHT